MEWFFWRFRYHWVREPYTGSSHSVWPSKTNHTGTVIARPVLRPITVMEISRRLFNALANATSAMGPSERENHSTADVELGRACGVILTPVPDADRHIDDDDLERYVLDRLSQQDAAPIDVHLLVCQHCQDRLAQVNQRVQAMRASRRRLG
jgi:uncharacterized protein YlaI